MDGYADAVYAANGIEVGHLPQHGQASAYTFPTEALAERVEFNETHMIIHLQDGRIVYVPLAWIPTLANATHEERMKVRIGWEGRLLHYDPDDGPINDDFLVASFMRHGEKKRADAD